MAWTAPFTAVAGSVFTAAQWNTFIRDNLAETMPARATSAGSWFAVSDTNRIVQRTPSSIIDTQSVDFTSTSFGDPENENSTERPSTPGPAVTVLTGVMALVGYRVNIRNASVSARCEASYEISGETSREAAKTRSIGYSVSNSASGLNLRAGWMDLATELTPGLNTFTLKYNVSSGSGVVNDRRLFVVPL
jgi:hypothetical protein